MKRVFLTVLDSCGIGEMPDSEKFGDKGANTLCSISKSKYFSAENMIKMGLGNIDGVDYLQKTDFPKAAYGKISELSAGKDTTTGHWEIAGLISKSPMPTFPEGFPDEVISEFEKLTGRKTLCNKPYSGTEVIKDYGDEHVKTGALIVYTSADSVFQIAAHEDVVPLETLYEYCRIARKILTGKYAVGRVIARPFIGSSGNYQRTPNRHDYSLLPPEKTLLNAICDSGKTVYAVGKIFDIFAGQGISEKVFTHSNSEGMEKTLEALDKDFEGLCFTNLVDFDMLYGHRRDIDGYAKAFAEFDGWLPGFVKKMRDDDVLIVTADHGCDPSYSSHTDHTREYIPLIVYGKNVSPKNLGVLSSFSDIAAFISDYLEVPFSCVGKNFLK